MPTPMPMADGLTGAETPMPGPIGAPPYFGDEVEVGIAPGGVSMPSVELSAAIGRALLIMERRVLVLLSGLL